MPEAAKGSSRFILFALAGAGLTILIGLAVYFALITGVFTGLGEVGPRPDSRGPLVVQPANSPWIQDFAAAKVQAAREQKDILLSFKGSDWCPPCQLMEREILATPEFLDKAPGRFVLVKVDFPQHEPALSQVRDPAANLRLQQEFGVTGYPTIILTDAAGDAYGGFNQFVDGGAVRFLALLDKFQQVRVERDQVLGDVERKEGLAKLGAAKQAHDFLARCNMGQTIKRYQPGWLELARQFDPNNKDGYVETFFLFDWLDRYRIAPTDQLPRLLTEMTDWRKQYGDFKDSERAAFICLELAKGKAELEDFQGAFMCLDEGLKRLPKDPITRQQLQSGPFALGLGTGTAFAVSSTGHYLTNAHVVTGPGKIFLQMPGAKQLFAAQLVAEKQDLDLALIKCEIAKGAEIKPLPITGGHVPRRGEEVGAWGYPLGTSFGHGLKLTKGVISALPEPGNRNMLLLDLRINPGNSGSPLCDAKGNVVGIVTARSQGFAGDAYGMALPGKEVLGFLGGLDMKSNANPGTEALAWDEIDRRISAGVAMVIKSRPMPKKGPVGP